MQPIDFLNIQTLGDSQKNSFERLICYLARYTINPNYIDFVKNNGSGGDGGVECYWTLNDGSEYGWQAKFFLNSMEKSQWQQLTDSVKTAIKRHPKIVKYYICIPRNLNDSRKERQGARTISERDKWNSQILHWKQLALETGHDIDFVLWDASRLRAEILNSSNSSTIADYWFGNKTVTLQDMQHLFQQSRASLGDRYSEEMNIELPLAKSLNCIAKNDEWLQDTKEIISQFYVHYHRISVWLNNKVDDDIVSNINGIIDNSDNLKKIISNFRKNTDCIFDNETDLLSFTKSILGQIKELLHRSEHSMDDNKMETLSKNEYYEAVQYRNFLEDFAELLESQTFQSGKKRLLLINGNAGSGKSHLLCDFSKKQLESNYPVVYLLGQNYSGGEPSKFINENLQLIESDIQLEFLELYGEEHEQRVLIVIDAVNEGKYNSDWRNYIDKLIQIIKEKSHLCLIISCRSTYQDSTLGKDISCKFPVLTHPGFRGNRSKAARIYLEKFDIKVPDIPFFPEGFTNPLFLHTICIAMKREGQHEFPKNIAGLSAILGYYRHSVEENVAAHLNIRSTLNVKRGIDLFTRLIYPEHLWGISYDIVYDAFTKELSGVNGADILEELIAEGIISVELRYDEEMIRFTFERFTDMYVSENLLVGYDSQEKLRMAFLPENKLGKHFIQNTLSHGILEILSVLIPERYQLELVDLIDWDNSKFKQHVFNRQWLIDEEFSASLILRSPDHFTERTQELFNEVRSYLWNDQHLEILIRLSLEPDHPWNAQKLDEVLRKLSMANRDALWSTYIAINDYEETSDEPESPIRTLLNWALEARLCSLKPEIQELLCTLLAWVTTTVNLKTRQSAERALTRLLVSVPKQILYIIKKFSLVNDTYIVNSVYACIYAAIIQLESKSQIQMIITAIPWQKLISNNIANISLGDSLTGIYQFAEYKGITNLPDSIIPIHKHSRLSKLVMPTKKEINALDEGYSSIESSAGSDFGDFGKYTMSMITDWSATRILDFDSPLTEELIAESFFRKKRKVTIFKKFKILDNRKNLIDNKALHKYMKNHPNSNEILVFMSGEYIDPVTKEKLEGIEFEKYKIKKEILKSCHQTDEVERHLANCNSKSIVRFDKQAAQYWVVKQAYNLGWTKELFGQFEETHCNSNHIPHHRIIERIGKKYERIALARLLAYISEQYYFIPQRFEDVDNFEYKGVWQFNFRENDLTYPVNTTSKLVKQRSSWPVFEYKQLPTLQLSDQENWLTSSDVLPDFSQIIQIKQQGSNRSWLVLADYTSASDKPEDRDSELLQSQFWYRVNSCVVDENDIQKLIDEEQENSFVDPYLVYEPNNFHQEYFMEYPWRNIYPEFSPENHFSDRTSISNFKYESLLHEYNWSMNGQESEIQIYQPSRTIISQMNLKYDEFGDWRLSTGKSVFYDPSIRFKERSRALFDKDELVAWLQEHNKVLVWLIGGEKQIYSLNPMYHSDNRYPYVEFKGFYYMKADGIVNGYYKQL